MQLATLPAIRATGEILPNHARLLGNKVYIKAMIMVQVRRLEKPHKLYVTITSDRS